MSAESCTVRLYSGGRGIDDSSEVSLKFINKSFLQRD